MKIVSKIQRKLAQLKTKREEFYKENSKAFEKMKKYKTYREFKKYGCLRSKPSVFEELSTIDMIERSKIEKVIAQLEEEKEFAYADFDEYNEEVLGYDDTDICERDACYIGIARAIEILKKL